MKAVEALLEGESGKALLVVGAPCVGKSTLARGALMAGLRRFGELERYNDGIRASDRRCDRRSGDSRAGATSQARPVNAVGHRVPGLITVMRSRSGEPLPRLLNGAEQDALLRSVSRLMCGRGKPCGTCRCCANSFARDDWDGVVGRCRGRERRRGW